MKKILIAALTPWVFGIAAMPAYAVDAQPSKAEAQKSYAAKGELIAVDKMAGKVKLKHEAVAELKWPAMTMFFTVADKAQLNALDVGTRVEFQFVKVNGGAPLITQIKPEK